MMTKSKLFGGLKLTDIAASVPEKPEAAAERVLPRSSLPTAELGLRGRTQLNLERESIYAVDPKRCRPWKYHNRSNAWYTTERCADLISSIAKDGQREPALARRLEGEPDYDYEIIYGMRRRFTAEHLNLKLKIRVEDFDDTKAAVLMHIENADREDVTPMERAISFAQHLAAKLFPTQDAMADALGVSKGQVTKMLKAAELMQHSAISQLLPDASVVPVEQAYKLAALLDRSGAKEVIFEAAKYLRKEKGAKDAGAVLKALIQSLDRSKKVPPLTRKYTLATGGDVLVKRDLRGKVTLTFASGLSGVAEEQLSDLLKKAMADFG